MIRPDWNKLRYNDTKINLSNNICYDYEVLDKMDTLMTKKFNFRQYPDEYIVYKSIGNHHNIHTSNIAIGYGLGELIKRILSLSKIKKLSIITPTWLMVEIFSNINNIEYSSTLDYTANALYIANPNGMNGSCLTKNEIIDLLGKFELVIVDESYGDFSEKEFSVLTMAPELDNLIVLKTMSKSLSLAGIRLGYAISNNQIIYELQLNRPSCVVNNILIPIIDDLFEMIPSHVSRMTETKKFIETTFECIPSHGNYVLIKNPPSKIEDHFMIKHIPNFASRVALTNLGIFKQCL